LECLGNLPPNPVIRLVKGALAGRRARIQPPRADDGQQYISANKFAKQLLLEVIARPD